MATNTKPRKKYKPKLIRTPSVVAVMNVFTPFEEELKAIIDTGLAKTAHDGTVIYLDNNGEEQSFLSALNVYTRLVEIYASRKKLVVDVLPLKRLMNTMGELVVIDEDEVLAALATLEICKLIITTMKPTELFDIFTSIRTAMAMR